MAGQLLRAVSDAHRYAETTVTLECGGTEFTAKGKTVLDTGWKQYLAQEKQDAALPELSEGQVLDCTEAAVKEGKTAPPKHYTEDTLLSAMETAERTIHRRTPSERGLERPPHAPPSSKKLVATGFVERKGQRRPSALCLPIPAFPSSPCCRSSSSPAAHRRMGIPLAAGGARRAVPGRVHDRHCGYAHGAGKNLQGHLRRGGAVPPPAGDHRQMPPRCGGEVTESKRASSVRKTTAASGLAGQQVLCRQAHRSDKKVAAALLAEGRVKLTGLYSEKTGGTYDATAVLEDTGERPLPFGV